MLECFLTTLSAIQRRDAEGRQNFLGFGIAAVPLRLPIRPTTADISTINVSVEPRQHSYNRQQQSLFNLTRPPKFIRTFDISSHRGSRSL